MRASVFVLVCVLLLSACAQTMGRDQVAQVLRDNPQLVFDAMKKDKTQLLDVLDQAVAERDIQDRKASVQRGLADPLKPVLASDRAVLGAVDAPVTIVEYSDFLCGYCGQASATITELLRRHPGKLRVYFKHVPLHQGSLAPAAAFEAISMQNAAAAWKFAEAAFANQQALAETSGAGIAALLLGVKDGVDMTRVQKDMQGKEVRARIEADVAEAKRFGVEGTPTFVVNGVLVRGALTLEEFEDLLVAVTPKK